MTAAVWPFKPSAVTIGEMAAADLRNMIADAPLEFTYDGFNYIGTMSGKNLRRPLEIGGFQDEPEITLVVALKTADRSPAFGSPPTVGDDIFIGLHRYRVDRTELDEFSEGLQLDLRSLNQ